MIEVPSDVCVDLSGSFSIMPAEGGGRGFLVLSGFRTEFWKRKADCDGVAGWVLGVLFSRTRFFR